MRQLTQPQMTARLPHTPICAPSALRVFSVPGQTARAARTGRAADRDLARDPATGYPLPR